VRLSPAGSAAAGRGVVRTLSRPGADRPHPTRRAEINLPGMDGNSNNPDDAPKRGRPTKLTDTLALSIALAILDGNYRYVAGRVYGVGKRTLVRWMQMGRRFPDGIYGQFRRLVVEAEAEWERAAVRSINLAGRVDDPKLLCWMLERKFPQRYGQWRGELGELKRRVKELEQQLAQATAGETDGED
jgi:hypothetical protein